jgi:transcriptional regulator with XRE-family HTH domain
MKKTIYSPEHGAVVEKLIKAREDAKLTQKQVAQKLGHTQSFISKIESGQRRVDVVLLKDLANLYNKDVLYFLTK